MTATLRRSLLIAAMITAAFIPSSSNLVPATEPSADVDGVPDLAGRWQYYNPSHVGFDLYIRRVHAISRDHLKFVTLAEFELDSGTFQQKSRLKWIAKSKTFESTTNFSLPATKLPEEMSGSVKLVMTLNDLGELRMEVNADETAKKWFEEHRSEARAGEMTAAAVDQINKEFGQMTWKRVAATDGILVAAADDQTSTESSSVSGTPEPSAKEAASAKNQSLRPKMPSSYESQDLIIKETKDGLSAYSKSLGKWERIVIPPPKDGTTRMDHASFSKEVAVAVIDDQIFGFSSKAGRWGQLTIPPQFVGKVRPVVDFTSASVRLGDEIYALSPVTGQWMSSDGTPAETKQNVSFTYSGMDSSAKAEAITREKLVESIAEYEKLTEALAKHIREAKQPANEKETGELTERRRKLNVELAKVFDMKAQLEKMRVKELQSRLSQLEQQVGQRQSQRDQIIERRARELIEGDATTWSSKRQGEPVGTSGPRADSEEISELISSSLSAGELYNLGLAQMKRGNRFRAYQAFKAAQESGLPLDPVRTQRMSNYLHELTLIDGGSIQQPANTRQGSNESSAPGEPRIFEAPKVANNSGETPRENTTQVLIRPAKDLAGSSPSIEYDGTIYPLPARLSFERGEKEFRHFSLRLLVGALKIDRPLQLDVYPATPNSTAFLSHNSVPFEISLNEAKATRVDKAHVVYLPDAKFQELAATRIRSMVVTGNTDSGIVFASADRDGTPLAALKLIASISEQTTSEPNAERASATSNPPAVVMSTSPSYKQLATDFETVEHELATAEIKLNATKKLFADKVISAAELAFPQQDFDTAQRKLEILKTTLKAELQDLELQISSDKVELTSAVSAKDKIGAGAYPYTQTQLDTATRRWEHAKLTLQRHDLQYKLLRNLAQTKKLVSADPISPQSAQNSSENLSHSMWKMRLDGLTSDELKQLSKTKYRSGLRVAEVEPDGLAANNGIKVGDILVGLDKWEIANIDNVNWIVNRCTTVDPIERIKFFVIRGSETKYGFIPLEGHTARTDDTVPRTRLDMKPVHYSAPMQRSYWGMHLTKLDEDFQAVLSNSKYKSGLRVLEVEPDSPAVKSNIQVGDILVGLDVFDVGSLEQVNWIANTPAAFAKLDRVSFRVYRGDHVEEGTLVTKESSQATEVPAGKQ